MYDDIWLVKTFCLGNDMKKLLKRYVNGVTNNYCPICGTKLSYLRKIVFLDWRYLHKCPNCKKYLTVKYSKLLWFIKLLSVPTIIILCIVKKVYLFKMILMLLLLFIVFEIVVILQFLDIVDD